MSRNSGIPQPTPARQRDPGGPSGLTIVFCFGIALVCGAVIFNDCVLHAHAQPPALERGDRSEPSGADTQAVASLEREALDLARVCVGEAGFDVAASGECAAIDAVIRSRAEQRRVSWHRALVDYSTAYFRATLVRRRWLFSLNAAGERPAHWDRRVPWSAYRPRWLEAIAHAREVRLGLVDVPCDEPPEYWGAPYGHDLARARAQGWRRLHCTPDVHNAYWRVR